MKAIRFGKLKNATIEQLETMLVVAKRNKLKEEVKILQATNPELIDYIKELGVIESYSSLESAY